MALVKLPEGQQRSGAQGGMVWSHNRTGPYTRERAVPVNPNTDRQVAVRNAVRSLAILWQNVLSQQQRDAWDLYASNVTWSDALGRSIFLTGLNHYIRSNVQSVVLRLTKIDAAPVIFNLAEAELELAAVASEATQLITVTLDMTAPWGTEDDGHEFIYCGKPQNSSRKFFGGPWRYGFVVNGADGAPPAGPFPFAYPWPFAENQRLWIRTRIERADGRLSEFAQINFLAAA